MTQVDFYILADHVKGNRFTLACRIIEKAWRQGLRVLVQASNEEDARHMDRLLWTFRKLSFIPHALHPVAKVAQNPVVIHHTTDALGEFGLLVNLQADVPPFFSQFHRVAEFIDADTTIKQAGRQRFKYYRERGYPLNSHTINH